MLNIEVYKKFDMEFNIFKEFINDVSDDFIPSLTDRLDINEYFEKLKTYASYSIAYKDNRVAGIVLFYCNNYDTKSAYITLLAVRKEYRRMHIASMLLERTIEFVRMENMETVSIHTNNEYAKDCYVKTGFHIEEMSKLNDTLARYFLRKSL